MPVNAIGGNVYLWAFMGIFLIFIIISTAFKRYIYFEPGKSIDRTVDGEVKAYTGCDGRPGTSISGMKNLCFKVELANGLYVYVRDHGELPIDFKGPVVLNLAKGQITDQPMYIFNLEKTHEIHNK